jgi:hypothetical protein
VISFFIISALLNLALIGATARTINAALARYPIPAGHCPAWSEAFSSMTVQLNAIATTSTGEIAYNVNMAAALLTALPPLLVYFASGRFFVRGITAGAVKG